MAKKFLEDCYYNQMDKNVYFGAKFIQTIPVKQYSYRAKTYSSVPVSFVELNPFDKQDLKTLEKIIYEFGDDSYAGNIYFDAKHFNQDIPRLLMRFFAITKQKDSFEKLKPEEILGLADITEKGGFKINLNYLQTHPQYLNSYPRPKFYKGIGTAIIDCLKNMAQKINLRSTPSSATINFYKKNGFSSLPHDKRLMIWEKKAVK